MKGYFGEMRANERVFADEELGGFLVTTDLTESDCSGSVTMGLLHTSGGRGALTGSLGCQLFPGGLASGGLSCGLLSTGHFKRRGYLLNKIYTEQNPLSGLLILPSYDVTDEQENRLRPILSFSPVFYVKLKVVHDLTVRPLLH